MDLPEQSNDAPAVYRAAPHQVLHQMASIETARGAADFTGDKKDEDNKCPSEASNEAQFGWGVVKSESDCSQSPSKESASGSDSCIVKAEFDNASAATSVADAQSVTISSSSSEIKSEEEDASSQVSPQPSSSTPHSKSPFAPRQTRSITRHRPPPSSSSSAAPIRSYTYHRTSNIINLPRWVAHAKKRGKTIHHLVHTLQNQFYPLIPPPGYIAPPLSLYRSTVMEVQRLYERGEVEHAVAPCWQRQPVTKRSWSSSVWSCLTQPLSICVRKRRRGKETSKMCPR
ncbi:hypothetical protein D9757_007220 [Collybiopsis confluens]|uniref:Uncharacterized protein n=1 Tax=Collybiopsis confluens TaxID=2823264 RepID=A0A8H5M3H3_9AGAR|nr:hypothetical protein D9757_007220 [Collybiopsis confluens]